MQACPSEATPALPAEPLSMILAYLDPGSGSMILQMILAGVAGLAVFLRYQGRRLVELFRRPVDDEDTGQD